MREERERYPCPSKTHQRQQFIQTIFSNWILFLLIWLWCTDLARAQTHSRLMVIDQCGRLHADCFLIVACKRFRFWSKGERLHVTSTERNEWLCSPCMFHSKRVYLHIVHRMLIMLFLSVPHHARSTQHPATRCLLTTSSNWLNLTHQNYSIYFTHSTAQTTRLRFVHSREKRDSFLVLHSFVHSSLGDAIDRNVQ